MIWVNFRIFPCLLYSYFAIARIAQTSYQIEVGEPNGQIDTTISMCTPVLSAIPILETNSPSLAFYQFPKTGGRLYFISLYFGEI